MNLPNALTISRLVLAPIVVLLLVVDADGSMPVAILFGLTAATDSLDGHLARSQGSVTRFGTVVDPVADKLLVLPVLLALVVVDRLVLWAALVILARELAVSGLRLVAHRQGTIIAASPFGKAKMAAQVATAALLIAVPDPSAAWVLTLVYATVIVTVVSGIEYFLNYRRADRSDATPSARPATLEAAPQRSTN
ncbi:MAG: CDP-diacylglycerol--glycerol-3-phosphate 3-phosphatidyltransferase [Thermoleophilaceae bacterium]|nr:CDP-diacylglycerol--glycerol-3-phosphate 3-phosphatidyltransferase [Thermoleophilaceae bacterium]